MAQNNSFQSKSRVSSESSVDLDQTVLDLDEINPTQVNEVSLQGAVSELASVPDPASNTNEPGYNIQEAIKIFGFNPSIRTLEVIRRVGVPDGKTESKFKSSLAGHKSRTTRFVNEAWDRLKSSPDLNFNDLNQLLIATSEQRIRWLVICDTFSSVLPDRGLNHLHRKVLESRGEGLVNLSKLTGRLHLLLYPNTTSASDTGVPIAGSTTHIPHHTRTHGPQSIISKKSLKQLSCRNSSTTSRAVSISSAAKLALDAVTLKTIEARRLNLKKATEQAAEDNKRQDELTRQRILSEHKSAQTRLAEEMEQQTKIQEIEERRRIRIRDQTGTEEALKEMMNIERDYIIAMDQNNSMRPTKPDTEAAQIVVTSVDPDVQPSKTSPFKPFEIYIPPVSSQPSPTPISLLKSTVTKKKVTAVTSGGSSIKPQLESTRQEHGQEHNPLTNMDAEMPSYILPNLTCSGLVPPPVYSHTNFPIPIPTVQFSSQNLSAPDVSCRPQHENSHQNKRTLNPVATEFYPQSTDYSNGEAKFLQSDKYTENRRDSLAREVVGLQTEVNENKHNLELLKSQINISEMELAKLQDSVVIKRNEHMQQREKYLPNSTSQVRIMQQPAETQSRATITNPYTEETIPNQTSIPADFSSGLCGSALDRTDPNFSLARVFSRMDARESATLDPTLRFNGNPTRWIAFETQCKVAFSDAPLTDGERLNHLITMLAGEPKKLALSQIGIADGFKRAWNQLKERYGETNVIANTLVQELIADAKPVSTGYPLIEFIDNIDRTFELLKGLNQTSQLEQPYVINNLVARFPARTRENWLKVAVYLKNHHQNPRQPVLQDIKDFLHKQRELWKMDRLYPVVNVTKSTKPSTSEKVRNVAHELKSQESSASEESDDDSMEIVRNVKLKSQLHPKQKKSLKAVIHDTINTSKPTGGANPYLPCSRCGVKDHQIFKCPLFKSDDLETKRIWVKEHKLCFNCLAMGHSRVQCVCKTRCKTCNKQHHTLLHPNNYTLSDKSSDYIKQICDESDSPDGDTYDEDEFIDQPCVTENINTLNIKPLEQVMKLSGHNVRSLDIIQIRVTGDKCSKVVNALLDGGSTLTCLDSKLGEMLFSDVVSTELHASGFIQDWTKIIKTHYAYGRLSAVEGGSSFHVKLTLINEFADSQSVPYDWHKQLRPDQFRIPHYKVDYPGIPLLIGKDTYEAFHCLEMCPEKPQPLEDRAIRSPLGWYYSGPSQRTKEARRCIAKSREFQHQHNVISDMRRISDSANVTVSTSTDSSSNKSHNSRLDQILNNYDGQIDNRKYIEQQLQDILTQDKLIQIAVEKWIKGDVTEINSHELTLSVEEQRAKEIQRTTIMKLPTGHYAVGLLWRRPSPVLHNNRPLAERRLKQLKRRLSVNEKLKDLYVMKLESCIAKGYAEEVPEEELNPINRLVYYLPHHPVIKLDKPDSIRIVYDCSANYKGQSLNSELMKGPNLLRSLQGILLRFRQHNVATISDIEGMFYQVKVLPRDKDCLRFLWWPNGKIEEPPLEYRMTCQAFGIISSPSNASSVLHQTADDNALSYTPLVTKTIHEDIYMDDCINSFINDEEAITTSHGIKSCLAHGGFNLTKFNSNSKAVLESFQKHERSTPDVDLEFEDIPETKSLGLRWNPEGDFLFFKVKERDNFDTRTKRDCLSILSQVYDPLCLVTPVILSARLIIQLAWKEDIGWDEPLPDMLLRKWITWEKELQGLSNLKLSRPMFPDMERDEDLQLHIFCDASKYGMGVVAYLRRYKDNSASVSFVFSRSKTMPVKSLTIPRAELQAGSYGVDMALFLGHQLTIPFTTTYWTDAYLVLEYLNNEKSQFTVFVSNRKEKILNSSTTDQWKHCPGNINPADIASRGATPNQLLQSCWFAGPHFLQEDEESWPRQPTRSERLELLTDLPELLPPPKKSKSKLFAGLKPDPINNIVFMIKSDTVPTVVPNLINGLSHLIKGAIEYYSSWNKLVKAITYLKQYARLVLNKRKSTSPTPSELNNTELQLLRVTQMTSVPLLYSDHVEDPSLISNDKFSTIIKNGLLRVGGRLEGVPFLSDNAKHPILIYDKDIQAKLILDVHIRLHHAGRQHIICHLRNRYYLVSPRKVINKILTSCILCRKYNSTPMSQIMSDLPPERFGVYEPAFTHSGVDLFGPLEVKRARSMVKRWCVIFTCLTCRAIYLDMVNDLTMNSFLLCLRRFISRKGKIAHIRSDQGTNFISAAKEITTTITDWNQNQIDKLLCVDDISWTFNTPMSPWMGGTWERLIKSVKLAMNKTLPAKVYLNDESLRTLLAEIESTINSRPLTYVDANCKSPEVLTPAHFVMLRPATMVPVQESSVDDQYSRKSWKVMNSLSDEYWKHWVKEYIPTVHLRKKWLADKDNIHVDDFVLIVDDNAPRSKWATARVTELHPSSDGKIRSVSLRTSRKQNLDRPIHKLCMLERVDMTKK